MNGVGFGVPFRAWVAATITILAGSLIFMYVVLSGVLRGETRFTHFEAPGEVEFSLDRGGTYTIYHELRRTLDNKDVIRPPGIGRLKFQAIRVEGDETLPLLPPQGGTYKLRRMIAEPLHSFLAPAAGRYRILAVDPENRTEEPFTMIVGQSYGAQVVATLLRGCAVLLLTGILTTIILLRATRHAGA
jgi:hypothetical protein